jgi:hypothetical protein
VKINATTSELNIKKVALRFILQVDYLTEYYSVKKQYSRKFGVTVNILVIWGFMIREKLAKSVGID